MAGFNLTKAIKNNLWLTVFSLLSLIVLLSLASWQVERLNWKNALIKVIEERIVAEPIKLTTDLEIKDVEFRKTSIKGKFLHAKEIHLAPKYYNEKIGFHILTPFRLSDGSGYVLVNRGWVPNEFKEQKKRRNTLASSEVTIKGTVLRPQRKNVFTPDNDLIKNYWFWVDIDKVSEYVGVKILPFVVVDEGRNVKNIYPIKLEVKPEIRNDHLQYAITWFSLALVLIVVYISYIVKNPWQKMKAYKELEKDFAKLSSLGGAMAILSWDNSVMMPKGGAALRAEQMATLDVLSHEILTAKKIPDLINKAKSEKLAPWQKRNLELMERRYNHSSAVDERLVYELTKAGSECEMIWRTARKENDFKTFSKHLKKVVSLVHEVADAKKAKFKTANKYDALLDQYDAGRKSAEIDKVFADLKKFLPPFLEKVLEKQAKRKTLPIKGKFPADLQKKLGLELIEKIGFDFNHGRLDVSAHPFCGGNPGDVRITTKYDEKDFTKSLMGVLHETGHALYENGLPEKWLSQPIGDALGMSVHESQSLFMEMQLCRSREFLKFAAPKIKKTFSLSGKEWEFENLYNFYTNVECGLIRIDADEVTYPLHVILRYEIEKEIINNKLPVEDLPIIWRSKMKEYLGVAPKDDKDGCMQDIHWTDGSFGYFPTYTLGALTAAQLFSAMKKEIPSALKNVERGDFKPIINWLRKNVHSRGSEIKTDDLIKKVTGEPLNAAYFKKHLENRYLNQ